MYIERKSRTSHYTKIQYEQRFCKHIQNIEYNYSAALNIFAKDVKQLFR